jgi:hypothetical protein
MLFFNVILFLPRDFAANNSGQMHRPWIFWIDYTLQQRDKFKKGAPLGATGLDLLSGCSHFLPTWLSQVTLENVFSFLFAEVWSLPTGLSIFGSMESTFPRKLRTSSVVLFPEPHFWMATMLMRTNDYCFWCCPTWTLVKDFPQGGPKELLWRTVSSLALEIDWCGGIWLAEVWGVLGGIWRAGSCQIVPWRMFERHGKLFRYVTVRALFRAFLIALQRVCIGRPRGTIWRLQNWAFRWMMVL